VKYSNWGYAYANGFVVLGEGLDMLILGAIATGGKMFPSANLSFMKRTLLGWKSGGSSQKGGIALAKGLCDSGGHTELI
jgi:hypothetical protein